MDDNSYAMRGLQHATTLSPTLISSSKYLNDPRLRDWIATSSLRRNSNLCPPLVDIGTIVPVMQDLYDVGRMEELFEEERKHNPALDRWLGERFLSSYKLEDLKDFGPDTVAGLYYKYMTENGFDVFRHDWDTSTHFAYYTSRLGQNHDFEHLLVGFTFELIAEFGPVFARIANDFTHFCPELAGHLNLIHHLAINSQMTRTALHYPDCWQLQWEIINQGMLVGKTSAPICMIKVEDVFHLTVPEAREKLGIRNARLIDTKEASDYWMEVHEPHPARPARQQRTH